MAANSIKTGRGGKGKPFAAGQSGNPSGRPKKTEEQITLENMCKARTPEALATILSIMDGGENERNRLSAAEFVIERGWGKATQPMDINVTTHEATLDDLA